MSRRALLGALASLAATAAIASPARRPESGARAFDELVARHAHLRLADVHNHGTAIGVSGRIPTWRRARLDRVVLFGGVSEPQGVLEDRATWTWYRRHPELIVPFSAGLDLRTEASLDLARANLEQGFFGFGELGAASTHSPIVANAEWKAAHPMYGALPGLYELCGEYGVPVLLHVDPPEGYELAMLEEALETYRGTTMVFAHINAYTSPDFAAAVLERHPNLYADFFAGFTDRNAESGYTLADFVPVAEAFPDRFMLGSDSGYAIGGELAGLDSMYRFLDLLDDPVVARKVAHDNLAALIDGQPATATQLAALGRTRSDGLFPITKREAGILLADATA